MPPRTRQQPTADGQGPEGDRLLFWRPDEAPQLLELEPDAYQDKVFGFVLDQQLDGDWWLSATLVRDGEHLAIGRLTIEPNFIKHPENPPAGGIGSNEVRRVRVGDVLARALAEIRSAADRILSARSAIPELASSFDELGLGSPEEQRAKEASAETDSLRPKRGRPRKDDEFYQRIAEEYLELQAKWGPRGLHQRMAERHGYSRDAARDWVKEARLREFLTPGTPGRAGAGAGARLLALRAEKPLKQQARKTPKGRN